MEPDTQRSHAVAFLWKVPLIAAVHFAGTMAGGALVTSLGLQFPDFPGQEYSPLLSYLAALVLVVFAFYVWLAARVRITHATAILPSSGSPLASP